MYLPSNFTGNVRSERVLACRLNAKRQTASDEYDVTHLNVHELQKIQFS